MQFSNIITLNRVACNVESASKKRALEIISELICTDSADLSQGEVFESLIAREKLGSTGLGKGIAIPHGRLKSGDQTIAAFLQLAEGVDFDAPDGEPVDLLCALLVPPESTDEHLEVLASLSKMFRKPELREKLRNSHDPQQIYTMLIQSSSDNQRENNS